MITKYVSESSFIDDLKSDEYANWSYGACKALYAYYEQLSDDIGEDIELDRVAIRCEWGEYDTCFEYASEFFDFEGMVFDDNSAREYLENRTTVLEAKTPNVTKNGIGYITSYVIQTF